MKLNPVYRISTPSLICLKSSNRASHPLIQFYCILILRCFHKLGQDLHHRCSVWTTECKARGKAVIGLLPSLAGGEEHGAGDWFVQLLERLTFALNNTQLAKRREAGKKGWIVLWWKLESECCSAWGDNGCSAASYCQLQLLVSICTPPSVKTQVIHGESGQYSSVPSIHWQKRLPISPRPQPWCH